MTIMILQPNEERQMGLTGGFLIVRRTEGVVKISSPDEGLVDTQIYPADIIELKGYRNIAVKNYSAVEVTIDLQSSVVPIRSNDGGSVTIAGGSITSILEPIAVTAEATVENGTVTNQSHLTLESVIDVTIAAGATVQVVAADAVAKKRTVIIQNISAAETKLRVGGASVAAGRGAIIKGSIDAIATFETDILGAVRVHNESGVSAKVTVSWGVR